MTFSIDNPERGLQQHLPSPFGKHVRGKPSGEQGLITSGMLYLSQENIDI